MVLNINGKYENVLTDRSGNIDLLDFAYLIEKYMGYDASDQYTKAVSSLYSMVDSLFGEVDDLNQKLIETVELSGL